MEFSETFELRHIIKMNLGTQEQYFGKYDSDISDHIIKYAESSYNFSETTPHTYVMPNFTRITSDSDKLNDLIPNVNTEKLSPSNSPTSPDLEIQKDEGYLHFNTELKISSLTQSLKKCIGNSQSTDTNVIHVYLFETIEYIDIYVSSEATIQKLKRTVIQNFKSNPKTKHRTLPNGTHPDAYEI